MFPHLLHTKQFLDWRFGRHEAADGQSASGSNAAGGRGRGGGAGGCVRSTCRRLTRRLRVGRRRRRRFVVNQLASTADCAQSPPLCHTVTD